MNFGQDRVFAQAGMKGDFHFDAQVAAVFPDMIERSIPGYALLLQLIGIIGGAQVGEGERVYDLGCSLGGVSYALSQHIPASAQLVAVDNSSAMMAHLRQLVREHPLRQSIELKEQDVCTLNFLPMRLACMVFTLQFIARPQRLPLLQRIHAALQAQGYLILAEKTALPPQWNVMTAWHERFKQANGYSALEVAQKRAALENVMHIDLAEEEEARLRAAGFSSVIPIFRGFGFVAWAALK